MRRADDRRSTVDSEKPVSAGAGRSRITLAVAACLLLAGPACREAEPPAEEPKSTFEQLQAEVAAMEKAKGPDALTQPDMEVMILALRSIPQRSADHERAQALALDLETRRRAAQATLVGPPPPAEEETVENFGPLKMKGAAPETKEALARTESITVGPKRGELIAAYGSCLERRTWFMGQNGGPSVELFHVLPECRDRLKPKIFQVNYDKVASVREGDLDHVMNPDLHRAEGAGEVLSGESTGEVLSGESSSEGEVVE